MNPGTLIFYTIMAAIFFGSEIVTRGHVRLTEQELVAISSQYSGIRRKYWGWSLLLIPLIFLTIHSFLFVAALYPSIEIGLRLLGGVVAVSYITLYQALFASLTGIYPIGRREDFVLIERDMTKTLAMRGIALVLVLLGAGVVLAMTPGFA